MCSIYSTEKVGFFFVFVFFLEVAFNSKNYKFIAE